MKTQLIICMKYLLERKGRTEYNKKRLSGIFEQNFGK